jgi:hypothetical protein
MSADKNEQIIRYLAAVPPAIAGQGGDNQTFKVACALYNGFALSEEETLTWLRAYNKKCEPPWPDPRLAYKASEAAKAAYQKPRGHLLRDQDDQPGAKLPKTPQASGSVDLKKHGHTCHTQNATPPLITIPKESFSASKHLKVYGKYGVKTKINDLQKDQAGGSHDTAVSLSAKTGVPPARTVPAEAGRPYVPTEAQLVRVPPGLTRAERIVFLQRDLEEALAYEPTPEELGESVIDLTKPIT